MLVVLKTKWLYKQKVPSLICTSENTVERSAKRLYIDRMHQM